MYPMKTTSPKTRAQREGREERDHDHRHLPRGAMEPERDEARGRVERQEIAEDADKLRQPKRAEGLIFQDRLLRVGRWRSCGG